MPDVIAQVTIKAGGVYHPPGSVVAISTQEEADGLVDRGFAEYAGELEEVSIGLDELSGAVVLRAAGIKSLDDVPRTIDELTAIDGIGKATARKILGELEA